MIKKLLIMIGLACSSINLLNAYTSETPVIFELKDELLGIDKQVGLIISDDIDERDIAALLISEFELNPEQVLGVNLNRNGNNSGNILNSIFVINPEYVNGDVPGKVTVSIKSTLSQMKSNLLRMQYELKYGIDYLVNDPDSSLEDKFSKIDTLFKAYLDL